jgi:hypothetical protein
MNRAQANTLVRQTFTQAFDKGRFANFNRELVNRLDESKGTVWNNQYVKDAFKPHVQRYERLGTYTSPDKETVDVLVVHLTADSKLERARTAIRNFVADHLKTRDEKDAALVAFVSPSETTWRFSYIKMEYATVEKDSGKIGVEARLTPARRFSYIVGEGESCHTAQTRFLDLLQNTETNPTLDDIEDAFSVETVTKEFFTRYAELFGDIHAALEKLAAKDKALRDELAAKGVNTVDFAKKLMGQIVFLYFLQKKGWLGVAKGADWGSGPRDFLRRLARGEYGAYDNFFNDALEPLFYDELATDRGHAAWSKRFSCRIPFLNGGLFEPLGDYDWRKTDILLSNKLFTNKEFVEEGITGTGVLDVFDRYNFTVNEAEPLEKEVAIDPEMLGKVFENLIEDNRRKGLGAYYTPREIVHYMCQETLINYLDTALNIRQAPLTPQKPKQGALFGGPDPEQAALQTTVREEIVPRADLETFVHLGEQISHYEAVETQYRIKMPRSIEQNARAIDEALAAITMCDPAVGSGAFPVGMMTEIVRARSALTPYFNAVDERTPYHFKRHAIQNCLYGVDIDAGAVEIAKLRLWLSLVVDEEDVKHIKPLPNLDYKIVAGNSLLGIPFKSQRVGEIEKLKQRFFDETDHDKKAQLKAQVDKLLAESFAASKKSLGYEVNFDFQVFFSEVFDKNGGFDVIIANPPYLGERGNKETFRLIATGLWGARFYKRKMDLFYFFFHLALDIGKGFSSLCFISTNYWITADGAIKLRLDLKDRATLLQLLSFGELKLFSSAQGQHNMITHMSKGKSNAVARTLITKRIGEPSAELLRSILTGSDSETIYYQIEQKQLFDGSEDHIRLTPISSTNIRHDSSTPTFNFEKIDEVSRSLSTYAEHVFMGVQTGCDIVTEQLIDSALSKNLISTKEARDCVIGAGIYVVTQDELEKLRLSNAEKNDCVKPFYKNSQIERYFTPAQNTRFLLYVDSQTDINRYPKIKAHLERFRPLLAAREQAVTEDHNWFWIRGSKRDAISYRTEAIVVPYRATSNRFSICNQDIFGAGDVYYIALKRQFSTRTLLGFLNSSLVLFHLLSRGKRKGRVIEYYKNPLENIPIHSDLLENSKCTEQFERLVDRIVERKRSNSVSDTAALEREIDQLVYQLYELTPEEIAVVEEATRGK